MGTINKVFVIGFNKTGTTSLYKALEILGYNLCPEYKGYSEELFLDIKKGDFTKLDNLIKSYSAFQDRPWNHPGVYKYINENYKESKFILSVRDTESWYNSYQKWGLKVGLRGKSYYKLVSNICYGTDDFLSNKKNMINTVNTWTDEVKNYFSDNKNLLIINLNTDNNWDKICNFLNKHKPKDKFPYANKNS